VLVLFLSSRPALAQLFPIPTELSAGLGGVIDRDPSAVVNLGLAWVYVRDGWIEPAIEMGLGGTSGAAPCQDEGPLARPETCTDGYVLGGLRFRPLRESDRARRPFIHLLMGGYWRGSGLKEPDDFLPGTFALQAGGGIDLRRPTSIHGLRLSADYRRVLAGAAGDGRHQLQVLVSYFIGWRGE
jgi:hypothetical protein